MDTPSQNIPQDQEAEQKAPSALLLELDEPTLFAVLSESSDAPLLDQQQIQELIEEEGYAQLYFAEDVLANLEKLISESTVGRFPLGEKIDAEIKVTVASDKSTASMEATSPIGGNRLNASDLDSILSENQMADECIDNVVREQVIEALGNGDPVEAICIANMIEPCSGEEATFELLFEEQKSAKPKQISDGQVDLRDIHDFLVVEPGTGLMRRTPATPGTPGLNVIGEEIPAEAGEDHQFEKYEGAVPDAEDPDLLVSEIKGHPVVFPTGVRIDNVLKLDKVDVSTGNIKFDGSVEILENVKSGFKVSATGNVLVKGLLEHAELEAGGNIEILGGVAGEGNAENLEEEMGCRIKAQGNIVSKFISMADVEAGADILVREYIIQCRVKAEGEVRVGQEGGKGCLIGGHTHAKHAVIAKVYGSGACVPTEVTAGYCKELNEKLEKSEKQKAIRIKEIEQLSNLQERLEGSEQEGQVDEAVLEKVTKIKNTIIAIKESIVDIDSQMEELQALLGEQTKVRVEATSKVFPGVEIFLDSALGEQSFSCVDEKGALLISGED